MSKLLIPVSVIVVGAIAVGSQIFREDPNVLVFGGGLVMVILGMIGASDRRFSE
jgi:hypothetical protein